MGHNKRLHDFIMQTMMESIFSQMGVPKEMLKRERKVSYQYLEYGCKSNLTDEDMIHMHIDFALQNGDKETFMKLTDQLKEGKHGIKLHV